MMLLQLLFSLALLASQAVCEDDLGKLKFFSEQHGLQFSSYDGIEIENNTVVITKTTEVTYPHKYRFNFDLEDLDVKEIHLEKHSQLTLRNFVFKSEPCCNSTFGLYFAAPWMFTFEPESKLILDNSIITVKSDLFLKLSERVCQNNKQVMLNGDALVKSHHGQYLWFNQIDVSDCIQHNNWLNTDRVQIIYNNSGLVVVSDQPVGQIVRNQDEFIEAMKQPDVKQIYLAESIKLPYKLDLAIQREIEVVGGKNNKDGQLIEVNTKRLVDAIKLKQNGHIIWKNIKFTNMISVVREDWPADVLFWPFIKAQNGSRVTAEDCIFESPGISAILDGDSQLTYALTGSKELKSFQYGQPMPKSHHVTLNVTLSLTLDNKFWQNYFQEPQTHTSQQLSRSSGPPAVFSYSNVQVVNSLGRVTCSQNAVGRAATMQKLLQLLSSPEASHITISKDLYFDDDLHVKPIVIRRTVEITHCSYNADPVTVSLDEMYPEFITVADGGLLYWHGDIILKGVQSSGRYDNSQLIPDAFKVEDNGVIMFKDIWVESDDIDDEVALQPSNTIHGFATPTHSAISKLQSKRDREFARRFTKDYESTALLHHWVLHEEQISNMKQKGTWLFSNIKIVEISRSKSGVLVKALTSLGIFAAIFVTCCLLRLCIVPRVVRHWRSRKPKEQHAQATITNASKSQEQNPGCSGSQVFSPGHTSRAMSYDSLSSRSGALAGLLSRVWGTSFRDSGSNVQMMSAAQSKGSVQLPSMLKQPSVTAEDQALHLSKMILESKQSSKGFGVINESDVKVGGILGSGAFGKVYKGSWRGIDVALKTVHVPGISAGQVQQRRNAILESAISTAIQHPNVVLTYAQIWDTYPSHGSNKNDSKQKQQAQNGGGEGSQDLHLIMEYCDRGTLRDHITNRVLLNKNQPLDDWFGEGIAILCDVARALSYLHSMNVVHADLKARNVLLCSTAKDCRGFVAKVADFGLANIIDANDTHISNFQQGTMTHMAPELLLHGHMGKPADVYSFGILMWEVFTGQYAFADVPKALLGYQIIHSKLRPEFPEDAPRDYVELAKDCWEQDVSKRPVIAEVSERLSKWVKKQKWARQDSARLGEVAEEWPGACAEYAV